MNDHTTAQREPFQRRGAQVLEHRQGEWLMSLIVEAESRHTVGDAARRSQKEDVPAGIGRRHRREHGRAVDRAMDEPAVTGSGGKSRRGSGIAFRQSGRERRRHPQPPLTGGINATSVPAAMLRSSAA